VTPQRDAGVIGQPSFRDRLQRVNGALPEPNRPASQRADLGPRAAHVQPVLTRPRRGGPESRCRWKPGWVRPNNALTCRSRAKAAELGAVHTVRRWVADIVRPRRPTRPVRASGSSAMPSCRTPCHGCGWPLLYFAACCP